MSSVEGAFVAALADDAKPRFADPHALAAALRSLDDAARAAYPELDVDPLTFARELARRLAAGAGLDQLARLRGDHVYLAVACEAGDARAHAHVERMMRAELDGAAHRLRARTDQADDVRGQLGRLLFTSEPGRVAGLASYSGRGDLPAYLRVIATRELVKVIDKGRREIAVDEASFLDKLSPVSDPEVGYLRDRYRADVDAAIRAALATMSGDSRALLRYSVIDAWSIDRIAELYGIHRATAARRVTAARDELGDAIRTELAARLAIPATEVDSLVRLVQSRVDVSLSRLLG